VKRPVWETVGGFNPALGHADKTEWFFRAEAAGIVHEMLTEVLMFRRMHSGNRSRVLASNSREEYLRLLKATLDRRRREARASGKSESGNGLGSEAAGQELDS
jgi:hypothetical protein